MVADNIPKCIGFIMDGNRRFARAHGLSSMEGHRRGAEKLREVCHWAFDRGIRYVIVYAFSTENWKRSSAEVEYLMKLFGEYATSNLREFADRNIRIKFIGERSSLSKSLVQKIERLEQETCAHTAGTLCLALSYGGRAEIVHAFQKLVDDNSRTISEEHIAQALWTHDLPDPDIIVRTGGEMRLSNFLLWQAAYAELFFTKTMWPDFSLEEFNAILAEYGTREQRRGA